MMLLIKLNSDYLCKILSDLLKFKLLKKWLIGTLPKLIMITAVELLLLNIKLSSKNTIEKTLSYI
jgi:hypothetical protein